jgi:hypothetical protein
MNAADPIDRLLTEQVAYYDARAAEYDEKRRLARGGDELVDRVLAPAGRVLFVDDAYRTADELVEGAASEVVQRTLRDGRQFRAVKVPHTAPSLQAQLAKLGWDIAVQQTAGQFFWGAGTRARGSVRSR